jgi:hypothetical protein
LLLQTNVVAHDPYDVNLTLYLFDKIHCELAVSSALSFSSLGA